LSERVDIDPKKISVILYNGGKNEWDDKTKQITAMYEAFMHGRSTGYNIYFRGGKQKYFYAQDRVKILDYLKTIPIENAEVIVEKSIIDAIRVDQFEGGYYRVYTGDKDFLTKQIRFESNKYKKIYQYFSELADKGLLIAEEKSPLYYLSKNFKRITSNQNSCLFDYLKGRYQKTENQHHIILPFSFNQSQRAAIENALGNNISIVEGPPGTGKTQTILNLIANIMANGYTCAVVSNNNTAIQNVYDKLTEEKLAFFVASLGSRERIAAFFSSATENELATFLNGDFKPLPQGIPSRIDQLGSILKQVQETENEVAQKRGELIEFEKEFEHLKTDLPNGYQIKSSLKSEEYLKLKIELESGKPLGIFARFRIMRKFKTQVGRKDNTILLDAAERLFYIAKIRGIKKLIIEKDKYLRKTKASELIKELQDLSRQVFTDLLNQRYINSDKTLFTSESYKSNFDNFVKRYPVLLSTSHSLLNNVGKSLLLDYLIIDEASQGDLLSSILAISCAKNLIVVGDSKQLQQIEDESLIPYSRELSKKYEIAPCFQYESNSILRSVKTAIPDIPTTLLKEHYRCAPDIIGFCNKMFYDNQLIAMTKNDGIHLNVIKTVPGNHARKNPNGSGQYNEREIDEIVDLLHGASSKDTGVITPFRCQADLIRERFKDTGIEADTVHKYQGRQKKEVILSFVVNSLDKSDVATENRLYDFVTNKELLNVAISRGIKKVTIVVSDKVYHSSHNVIKDLIDYIEYLYGDSVTRESTIISIFDNLYIEHRDALIAQYRKKSQIHYTELLMNQLIYDVLKSYRGISFTMHARVGKLITDLSGLDEEEKRYITHPWTHVDFLFYNSISKKPLFALEVDGIRHHEQNIEQSVRDAIKNKAFEQCGIQLYRFKTNESGEDHRLKSILNQYGHY
jgi:superfamily I DNA and/or RNA helicase